MRFKKVSIIGVGLIGGSLALAMKRMGLARTIVGICRHKESIALARRKGVIDAGSLDIKAIQGSDLVILAMPVGQIMALAKKISLLVSKECIVTDVGSAKEEIVGKLDRVFKRFVGAHPLSGSEKRGVQFADAGIFKDTLCILTPGPKTDPLAKHTVEGLWRRCGARVIFLDPGKHDRVLSFVSHLPHLAAFSLIDTVPAEFLRFSASGLKDTTRIASSDAVLWADIFLSNHKLLKAVDLYQAKLAELKKAIKGNNRSSLVRILRRAKNKRAILK